MADKTEAPTPHRLEEAREEGQVVRSQELITAVVILSGAYLLRGPGKQLGLKFEALMTETITQLPHVEISVEWLRGTFFTFGSHLLPTLGLMLFILMLAGSAVTLGQTQFLWAGKKIGFDFKRVNPLEGFKRIFSRHGLIELLRSLLKLGWVSWVAYSFLRSRFAELASLTQVDLKTSVDSFVEISVSLAIRVGAMYFVLAVADYAYQRWELYKNLRMSKDEIKQEVKRSEGDPMLKSRIRSMQRRMARGRMMANVSKAAVVVTNPTHLAVAIEYHEGMKAPRVLAKGPYKVAQRIVQIAKENNIPVVQNIPLARAIYKTIEIGHEISADLYLAMAEVLAYVYKLRGKTPFNSPKPKPQYS
ncbi:MAG TPA: flagellar biosynthesis protein FlhB [Anaerolineales bacterium]|nr:flagellar biosynthesis protein FlhB [Anaerolineales bacterium]HNN13764.1 flagellar biosynthesis protein FlhB [Anaerolineales bacterium]HNO30440.1 flagellar biosynthesis protein FlhB [Anaerolineales bacterium]